MASLIPAKDLIHDFQSYYDAGDGYIAGTSGETWTAEKQARATDAMAKKYGERWIGHKVEDCSGAFVRAYKAHGKSIYHGSNRIARSYVMPSSTASGPPAQEGKALLPISEARPGMAAFKARKPGEQGYDLPDQYKPGGSHYNGDLNDYYHIGLVDADPRYVINAQSTMTGVVRSKIQDGWDAAAYLKNVDYNDEGSDDEMGGDYLYEATVDSANDKPVNLRKSPSVNAAVIATVKDGTRVKVLCEADADWAEIDTGSKTGYMMRGFLVREENAGSGETAGSAELREALRQILEIARKALQEGGD